MRKRFRILVFAALVAAFVVPVGFALSVESSSTEIPVSPVIAASTVAAAPLIVDAGAPADVIPGIPDGAKLFMVGAGLFGLAAAVRKAA